MLKKKNFIYFMAATAVIICTGMFAITDRDAKAELIDVTQESVVNDTEYETEHNSVSDGQSTTADSDMTGITGNDVTKADEQNTTQQVIYVYVCGKVNSPGVYELPEGTRVYKAIEAAGGATEEAALENLNLADVVSDKSRIYIPGINEEYNINDNSSSVVTDNTANSSNSAGSCVNINVASKNELMTLPGIGEAKALAIISYRETQGKFTCIEDVMKVSGIKNAAYEKIKDYISVN